MGESKKRLYPHTDVGNAKRFRDTYGGKVKFVSGWGWLVYNGNFWGKRNNVLNFAEKIAISIRPDSSLEESDENASHLMRWSKASQSHPRLSAMVRLARNYKGILYSPDSFDANPWLLNCKNGTLDLYKDELYPHKPEDLITKYIPINYTQTKNCPLWFSFLDRIFEGNQVLIEYLQKSVGYTLTGLTKEQVLFILYGKGNNGKTTFLETLRFILNDYSAQADFNTFLERKSEGARNDLARLAGKRFVTATEIGRGKKMAEEVVKQITGGDKVTARFLYKEYFEYAPQFKIFMATNNKPVIRGTDLGIWRRIRLIPFSVIIAENERDYELSEKLKDESEGILAWAVEGCRKWKVEGLGNPPGIMDASKEYRAEMDKLGAFIEDCCVIQEGTYELFGKLYSEYLSWCNNKEVKTLSEKAFGFALKERGFEKGRKNQGAIRKGINLKNGKAIQVS